eukprot:Opistho-2@89772
MSDVPGVIVTGSPSVAGEEGNKTMLFFNHNVAPVVVVDGDQSQNESTSNPDLLSVSGSAAGNRRSASVDTEHSWEYVPVRRFGSLDKSKSGPITGPAIAARLPSAGDQPLNESGKSVSLQCLSSWDSLPERRKDDAGGVALDPTPLSRRISDDAASVTSEASISLVDFLKTEEPAHPVLKRVESDDMLGSREVETGTLKLFVQRLTSGGQSSIDQDYVWDFLLTFRYFTTPVELLQMLIHRYKSCVGIATSPSPNSTRKMSQGTIGSAAGSRRSSMQSNDDAGTSNRQAIIQLRVVNVLKKWMTLYWSDFSADRAVLLENLKEFITGTLSGNKNFSSYVDGLKALMADLDERERRERAELASLFVQVSPDTNSRRTFHLLEVNPRDIAEQLTLIEFKLFQKVSPQSLILQAWTKGASHAPALCRLIERFNEVSFWIASEVCLAGNLKQRSAVIKWAIQIAKLCREMNNFNTCLEIIAALNLSYVQRLKLTWKQVNSKSLADWRELNELMDTSKGYRNYRDILGKGLKAPILPYIGVDMKDLVLIEEGNETVRRDDGQVNFVKMKMIARVVRQIEKYQRTSYSFEEDPEVQDWLLNGITVLDDKKLQKHSLLCEPRFVEAPDQSSGNASAAQERASPSSSSAPASAASSISPSMGASLTIAAAATIAGGADAKSPNSGKRRSFSFLRKSKGDSDTPELTPSPRGSSINLIAISEDHDKDEAAKEKEKDKEDKKEKKQSPRLFRSRSKSGAQNDKVAEDDAGPVRRSSLTVPDGSAPFVQTVQTPQSPTGTIGRTKSDSTLDDGATVDLLDRYKQLLSRFSALESRNSKMEAAYQRLYLEHVSLQQKHEALQLEMNALLVWSQEGSSARVETLM